jgi:hypothetical protein
MIKTAEIQKMALQLPARSRLKLAGELLRSTAPTSPPEETLAEASRRDEEIASGKVKPLDEAEFWRGVKKR